MSGFESRVELEHRLSMRVRSLVAGLFLIVSLAAANTPAGSNDLKALQVSWKLVSGEIGGQKMTAEQLKKAKLVFNGDRYTVRRGNGPTVMGIVKINAAKNPRPSRSLTPMVHTRGKRCQVSTHLESTS
jgi:uncharacterized protein (TIGR03067 family)